MLECRYLINHPLLTSRMITVGLYHHTMIHRIMNAKRVVSEGPTRAQGKDLGLHLDLLAGCLFH